MFESQMYPQAPQPTFPSDSFGGSAMTAAVPPPQPSQTGNLFPSAASGVPFQSSGGSGADFFIAAAPQTHSEVAPAPPQSFTTGGGQITATESDAGTRQPGGFQRHSSAPSLPGASTLFGGATPQSPNNQPDSAGTNFFSSQQQPSLLEESSSQGESFTHFRDGRQQERPYSQEPPSPHQQSWPVVAFGSSGSVSAPSTTLHQVLPNSDQHLQHQAASDLPQQQFSQTEGSGSPMSPFRPPSNADIHVQGVPPPGPGGADYQQMTNADLADSNSQVALNSSGMVPNQVQPGQVHPSLTEDLGMTNASHGSMANLRTNASTDADLTAISAAIEDATCTTPDEATGPVQWGTSGQTLSNVESSGSSREKDSSLNLDSKSVSSLLEGSQDDFSHYSPIRLLPPAPLGGEQQPQSPQTLSTLQQQQYASSSGVTLLPAAPQTGPGMHTQGQSESREELQFAVEHGHEKKASDDLKDWEIVDSVPPASEVSQLPSSVRLLPPSSFASISTQPPPTVSSGGSTSEPGGVSQAIQKLSLEPSRSQDIIEPHPPPGPPPSQRQGSHTNDSSMGVMSAGSSLPHPTTSSEKASPVAPFETNFTNLEKPPPPPTTSALQSHPPPTTSVGYHRPSSGHSESHLSSNLPEPKEISSLITQIPFLTPVTSTTSLFTSQPSLLTQQPPACSSSTSTAAPLGLHSVSSTSTSTASAVTLVPSLPSLQTGGHQQHHLEKHQEHQQHQQLPISAESSVRGGIVTAAAAPGGLTQQQFQAEVGVPSSSQFQAQAPVSAPVQPGGALSQPGAQTSMGDRDVHQPHITGSQQTVGAETSSVNAQSNLPAHSLPMAVTSAFEAPSTTATEQLPGASSITAVPGNPQMTAALLTSRPELAPPPPPPSSLPHTTSAFVQVQQQQQGLVEASSNLPGRPDSNVQPPLQIQPAMTQSQPGISTGPPPPIPTLTTPATATYPEAGAQVVATSSAVQQHHNPPQPTHTTAAPVGQPPQPQSSSEPQRQQPTDESQKQTEPQPPPQSQVTTGVPTTTYASSSLYQEERHEQGGGGVMEPSHAPPHHHHHPPDGHGYYHDSYYHDRDRDSYYGDPRDTRYRAPSAFSEREADPHYGHGYHPRPDDNRVRYDYSHYPDHPLDAGYGRYGPNYGYDDHYSMGGGYSPLHVYGQPTTRVPLRDEYGMPPPRTPYYDPYDPYGYHHPHAHHHHHQRPYDPRYGGHYAPPPGSRGPPYGREYPPDPLYDPYHQPSAAYEHDPRVQQQSESGYDSHTYPPQQPQPLSYNPHEELNPAEASAIGGQINNFEVSQFVESPNTRLPSRPHPQEVQHNSTAYLDPQQPQQYPEMDQPQHVEYAGEQHGYHHPEHGYVQVCKHDQWTLSMYVHVCDSIRLCIILCFDYKHLVSYMQ